MKAFVPLLLLPLYVTQSAYQSVQPTFSELADVARALVEKQTEIAKIWDGFWRAGQPFLLMAPEGGAVLVNLEPGKTSVEGFSELPSVPRSYSRTGLLPNQQKGVFPGVVEWGGERVYALAPLGSTLSSRVAFFVHESFHFHQRSSVRPWRELPEDAIMGLSPKASLTDAAFLDDPSFLQLLKLEEDLLRRLAVAKSWGEAKPLVAEYLAHRRSRLRNRPDLEAIEHRYERREGSAEFVGCRAGALSLPHEQSPSWLASCLTRKLITERRDEMQMLRWRLYGAGAVMYSILDRFDPSGWRQRAEEGLRPSELLRELETQANGSQKLAISPDFEPRRPVTRPWVL